MEIVAPTAGVIVLLVVLAGLFLWWRKRGNNQDDEERRPLQQDGPGQDGAHRIPDAPPENMEGGHHPLLYHEAKTTTLA